MINAFGTNFDTHIHKTRNNQNLRGSNVLYSFIGDSGIDWFILMIFLMIS
jgi:hypothetical protein